MPNTIFKVLLNLWPPYLKKQIAAKSKQLEIATERNSNLERENIKAKEQARNAAAIQLQFAKLAENLRVSYGIPLIVRCLKAQGGKDHLAVYSSPRIELLSPRIELLSPDSYFNEETVSLIQFRIRLGLSKGTCPELVIGELIRSIEIGLMEQFQKQSILLK